MKRMTIAQLRQLPNTLDGVKLTATRRIQLALGSFIEVGTDLTEVAAQWANLPLLIKRGDVKADPPVDYRSLVILSPDQGKKWPHPDSVMPSEAALENPKPVPAKKNKWAKKQPGQET